MIPHPPIILHQIRTTDIWFLLGVGALWEFLSRLYQLMVKIKPRTQQEMEADLIVLQAETDRKRKLGPVAFVETSKLERKMLVMERELQQIKDAHKRSTEQVEKILSQSGNFQLSILVFLLYYGVAMITLEDVPAGVDTMVPADAYLRTMLFPLSYVGLGVRLSRWGLPSEIAGSSLGALMVLWSAQVTVSKLMDAVDAYYL